jgi:hypothetical protein
MSDTPRTDAEEFGKYGVDPDYEGLLVTSEFAKQLERELSEMTAKVRALETSDVLWCYEDELPAMGDDDFKAIFKASRVDGVRIYPFVEDSKGNRIWITHFTEKS